MGDIQDIKPIVPKKDRPAPAVEINEDGTITQGEKTYGSSK